MADTQSMILRKTDPFVLDETVENLETISSNSSGSSNSSYACLPLGSNRGGSGEEDDRPFLETPFNKVANTTTKYRKPGDASAFSPSEKELLEFEETANEVWDSYRMLYYGPDAVGSVYVQRKGGPGSSASSASASASSSSTPSTPSKTKNSVAIEALFGIQKICRGGRGGNGDNGNGNGNDNDNETARWDSVHTVTIEVPNNPSDGTCEYKIRSAVWCRYKPDATLDEAEMEVFDKAANHWDSSSSNNNNNSSKPSSAASNKGGTPAVVMSSAVYTKDTTKVCKTQISRSKKAGGTTGIPIASHIRNIGGLIEKIETDFRSRFERVDAPRCTEVLTGMHSGPQPSSSSSQGSYKAPGSSRGAHSSSSSSPPGGGAGRHATGMGVGMVLIGEIANRARSKGLGGGDDDGAGGSTTTTNNNNNKALEGILANEKKKLAAAMPPMVAGFQKPNLRKAVTDRPDLKPSKAAPTPEFMNFRSKLKPTAAAK